MLSLFVSVSKKQHYAHSDMKQRLVGRSRQLAQEDEKRRKQAVLGTRFPPPQAVWITIVCRRGHGYAYRCLSSSPGSLDQAEWPGAKLPRNPICITMTPPT